MEVPIEGAIYRTRKLNARQQRNIFRRVMPGVFEFYKSAQQLAEGEARGPNELKNEESLIAVSGPIIRWLHQMSDDDFNYIVETSLSACEKKVGEGWQVVQTPNGVLVFEDIDLQAQMILTRAVIMENLSNFFKRRRPEE